MSKFNSYDPHEKDVIKKVAQVVLPSVVNRMFTLASDGAKFGVNDNDFDAIAISTAHRIGANFVEYQRVNNL